MAVTWLKKAAKTPATEEGAARAVVAEMLAKIEAGGEVAALDYAKRLDGWDGPVVVGPEEIERRAAELDAGTKRDIERAIGNVRRFAEAQRESIREFSVELAPGISAGQRLIPVNAVGAYVPAGRYAYIASAYMAIAVAKAAGVPFVAAASAPYKGGPINAKQLYAMHRSP